MFRSFVFLFCLIVVISCKTKENSPNKFSDPIFVKIAELQDRRQSDSLYQYFTHENPAYRKDAVLAFASIQDTLAISKIADVLKNDSSSEVKSAAAFALGQTGTTK